MRFNYLPGSFGITRNLNWLDVLFKDFGVAWEILLALAMLIVSRVLHVLHCMWVVGAHLAL